MWRFLVLALMVTSCRSAEPGQACTDPNGKGVVGMIAGSQLGSGCDELDGSAPGSACTSAVDCAPICCACGGEAGGQSIGISYCQEDGTCATANVACCTFLVESAKEDAGLTCNM